MNNYQQIEKTSYNSSNQSFRPFIHDFAGREYDCDEFYHIRDDKRKSEYP